jgi:hypothetical protein
MFNSTGGIYSMEDRIMTILKFIGGAIAAVVLIKIAFWLLGMMAGIVQLVMSLVFLALAVAIVVFIVKFVYRVVTGEQKGTV